VFGLVIEGVGGTVIRATLLLAEVTMVKPKLVNFRRGGVGGFTNTGDTDAGALSIAVTICEGAEGAEGAEVTARPKEYVAVAVSTARFLRLRAFFAGVAGRCISKKGSVLDLSGGLNRDASAMPDNEEMLEEPGVSGEVPGEDSVIEEESIVDTVVVGEESEDSDADVDSLFRGWWKLEKGGFIEQYEPSPEDAGRGSSV
jgi:hypothetical protein